MNKYITFNEAAERLSAIANLISDMHWDHTFHPENVGNLYLKASKLVDELKNDLIIAACNEEIRK